MNILHLLIWYLIARFRDPPVASPILTLPTLPAETICKLMNTELYQEMTFDERWNLASQLVQELVIAGLSAEQAEFVRDKISAAIFGLAYAPEN